MEAHGDKGYLRRRRIHEEASEDGEIYTAHGVAVQEGKRNASYVLCSANSVLKLIDYSTADLKATFQLQILGVKKNPQSPMYTQLGVMTKGTVIEVNVSELGMVTTGGKVVFGKYAQITNNPEGGNQKSSNQKSSHPDCSSLEAHV